MGRKPLVVLDGAHNLEAFQELRRALRQFFPYRRLILVLGILADKAVTDMLMEIVPRPTHLLLPGRTIRRPPILRNWEG